MPKTGKKEKRRHAAVSQGKNRRCQRSSGFLPKSEVEKNEKRRLRRNLTERNRQNQLSAYFYLLRQMMVGLGLSKIPETKVQILNSSIDLIRKLIEDNIKLNTVHIQMSHNLEAVGSSSNSSVGRLHVPVGYNLTLLPEQFRFHFSAEKMAQGANRMLKIVPKQDEGEYATNL